MGGARVRERAWAVITDRVEGEDVEYPHLLKAINILSGMRGTDWGRVTGSSVNNFRMCKRKNRATEREQGRG